MSRRTYQRGTVSEVPLQIILRQPHEPLVTLAAEELQRYVRQLFGFHPPLCRGQDSRGAQSSTVVGADMG